MQSKLWQVVWWNSGTGMIKPIHEMLPEFPTLNRRHVINTDVDTVKRASECLNTTSPDDIMFFVVQCEDLTVAV